MSERLRAALDALRALDPTRGYSATHAQAILDAIALASDDVTRKDRIVSDEVRTAAGGHAMTLREAVARYFDSEGTVGDVTVRFMLAEYGNHIDVVGPREEELVNAVRAHSCYDPETLAAALWALYHEAEEGPFEHASEEQREYIHTNAEWLIDHMRTGGREEPVQPGGIRYVTESAALEAGKAR